MSELKTLECDDCGELTDVEVIDDELFRWQCNGCGTMHGYWTSDRTDTNNE